MYRKRLVICGWWDYRFTFHFFIISPNIHTGRISVFLLKSYTNFLKRSIWLPFVSSEAVLRNLPTDLTLFSYILMAP